jgi:hypothetical protein
MALALALSGSRASAVIASDDYEVTVHRMKDSEIVRPLRFYPITFKIARGRRATRCQSGRFWYILHITKAEKDVTGASRSRRERWSTSWVDISSDAYVFVDERIGVHESEVLEEITVENPIPCK